MDTLHAHVVVVLTQHNNVVLQCLLLCIHALTECTRVVYTLGGPGPPDGVVMW